MTDITVRPLPSNVAALVEPGFEEALYPSALSLLTSHLAAEAASGIYTIPPPSHLALLITMLVHPSTTNTSLRRQSSHLLSRVLDVASPREAKFDQVWTFERRRKRRAEDSDSDDIPNELEQESLFSKAESIWDVIEWSFFKSEGGWVDVLNHIVRMLRNDFEGCKMNGVDEIAKCILVKWLRDSGGKATFPKAVRSVLATADGQMMFDKPKGIYEGSSTVKVKNTSEDIWGGSILLNHRIEILSMMHELARLYPDFLNEGYYLDALMGKLLPLKFETLTSFLYNIPSLSFRIALCEFMAQQLSPESVKLLVKHGEVGLSDKLLLAYIPSVPPTGREGPPNLAKYCMITGILFRGWLEYTNAQEGCSGLRTTIERAIERRKGQLESMKQSARAGVEDVVKLEGRMLETLALKLERDTGVV